MKRPAKREILCCFRCEGTANLVILAMSTDGAGKVGQVFCCIKCYPKSAGKCGSQFYDDKGRPFGARGSAPHEAAA